MSLLLLFLLVAEGGSVACSSSCLLKKSSKVCYSMCNVFACEWSFRACIPNCPSHCLSSQLGDGICDPECNIEDCQWDEGDCVGECDQGCTFAMLGDGTCDAACKNKWCNYDDGDCHCSDDMLGNGVCDSICQFPEFGFDMADCAEFVYVNSTIPGLGGTGTLADPYLSFDMALRHNFTNPEVGVCFLPGVHNLTQFLSFPRQFSNVVTHAFLSCRPCVNCTGVSTLRLVDSVQLLTATNLTVILVEDLTIDGSQRMVPGCVESYCMFCRLWRCDDSVTCTNELDESQLKSNLPLACLNQVCDYELANVLTVNQSAFVIVQNLEFFHIGNVSSLIWVNNSDTLIANIMMSDLELAAPAIYVQGVPVSSLLPRIMAYENSRVYISAYTGPLEPYSANISNVSLSMTNSYLAQGFIYCLGPAPSEAGAVAVTGINDVRISNISVSSVYNFGAQINTNFVAFVNVERFQTLLIQQVALAEVQSRGGGVLAQFDVSLTNDFSQRNALIQDVFVTDSLFNSGNAAVQVYSVGVQPIFQVQGVTCLRLAGTCLLLRDRQPSLTADPFYILHDPYNDPNALQVARFGLVQDVAVIDGLALSLPLVSIGSFVNVWMSNAVVQSAVEDSTSLVAMDAKARKLWTEDIYMSPGGQPPYYSQSQVCLLSLVSCINTQNLTLTSLSLSSNICFGSSLMSVINSIDFTLQSSFFQNNTVLMINTGLTLVTGVETGFAYIRNVSYVNNKIGSGCVLLNNLTDAVTVVVADSDFYQNVGSIGASINSHRVSFQVLGVSVSWNVAAEAAGIFVDGTDSNVTVGLVNCTFDSNAAGKGTDLSIVGTLSGYIELLIDQSSFLGSTGTMGSVLAIETGTHLKEAALLRSRVSYPKAETCIIYTDFGVFYLSFSSGVFQVMDSVIEFAESAGEFTSLFYTDIEPNNPESPTYLSFSNTSITHNSVNTLLDMENDHTVQTAVFQSCTFVFNHGLLFSLMNANVSDFASVISYNDNSGPSISQAILNTVLTFTQTTFTGNTATRELIIISEMSSVHASQVTFSGNKAEVALIGSTHGLVAVTGSEFEGNVIKAGSLLRAETSNMTLTDTYFTGNSVADSLLFLDISSVVADTIRVYKEIQTWMKAQQSDLQLSNIDVEQIQDYLLSADLSTVVLENVYGVDIGGGLGLFSLSKFIATDVTTTGSAVSVFGLSKQSQGIITNSTFTRASGTVLQIDSSDIRLQDTNFDTNLQSCVFASLSHLLFLNVSFHNNSENSAILLQDSYLNVSSSVFSNNSASIGGALSASCSILNCSVQIQKSSFVSNTASQGGAMFFSGSLPVISEVVFDGNNAVYGPDIGTPPARLVNLTKFPVVASGQLFQSPVFALVDHFGAVMTADNSSKLVFTPVATSGVKGLTKVLFDKGTATFDNLYLTSAPGASAWFEIQADNVPSLLVQIEFRNCIVGEILLADESCYECEVMTYSFNTADKTCSACPDGAICYGGANVIPQAGYWRSSNSSLAFYECPNPNACLQSTESQNSPMGMCATGYFSNLCAACVTGYYRSSDNDCAECPEMWVNVLTSTGVLLLFLGLVTITVRSTLVNRYKAKSMTALHMKLLVNYLHVTTIISAYNLNWSSLIVLGLFRTSGVAGNTQSFLSVDCYVHSAGFDNISYAFASTAVITSLPYLQISIALLFWFVVSILTQQKTYPTNHAWATIVIVLFTMHSMVMNSTLELFNCRELDNGMWLVESYSTQCWEEGHLKMVLVIGIPSVLAWIVGFPMWLLIVLRRSKVKERKDSHRLRYGFLYNGYKEEYCFWEIIVWARKITIKAVDLLLPISNVMFKALVALSVIFLTLYIQRAYQPYESESINRLEQFSLWANLLTLMGGLLLVNSVPSAWEAVVVWSVLIINFSFIAYTMVSWARATLWKGKVATELIDRVTDRSSRSTMFGSPNFGLNASRKSSIVPEDALDRAPSPSLTPEAGLEMYEPTLRSRDVSQDELKAY